MSINLKALMVEKDNDGTVTSDFKDLSINDLPEGEVLIKVQCSGINYKDVLATVKDSGVLRSYPMIPGIDLASTIVESDDLTVEKGEEVIIADYNLDVNHYSRFGEYARVKLDWTVECPENPTLKETMIYGAAGYTAGLAVEKLEKTNFTTLEGGEILVHGAFGGVGSLTVMMLNELGYKVVASTGDEKATNKLEELGTRKVIDRISEDSNEILGKRTWQAIIGPCGGPRTPYIAEHLTNGGGVTLIGMTGGDHFETSVFPFILRGVNVVGLSSAMTPIRLRQRIWRRLATDLKSNKLHKVENIIAFRDLKHSIEAILNHKNAGRIIINFKA